MHGNDTTGGDQQSTGVISSVNVSIASSLSTPIVCVFVECGSKPTANTADPGWISSGLRVAVNRDHEAVCPP